ncbi:MAG: trigger factor [Verrucomicrobiota bacterium]
MKIQVEDEGKCRKRVHVEAPAEKIQPEYDRLVQEYRKVARIPGFRKGRAPSEVVEKRFLKDILENTKQNLLPRIYKEAVEEEDIAPVAVIDVSNERIGKDEGLSFDFTVDVAPEFKLPRYGKISLKGQKTDVTDEEIEEAVHRVMDSMARYEENSGQPAGPGDMLQLDYSGAIEGKPVSEMAPQITGMGEGSDFWIILNGQEFLPGLSKQLEGVMAGDSKTLKITFPEDYHVKEVAGKDASYDVTVKRIRKKVLPEMDEEFFKNISAANEAEFREKVKEELVAAKTNSENRRLKNEISRHLLDKTDLDVPVSQLEQEKNAIARNMIQSMAQQGLGRQQLEERKDQILSEAEKTSVDRVKLMYILGRIAEEENIEVAETEVDERIESMASGYGMETARMKAELEKQNALDRIKSELRQEKTLDFLLGQAKIKK